MAKAKKVIVFIKLKMIKFAKIQFELWNNRLTHKMIENKIKYVNITYFINSLSLHMIPKSSYFFSFYTFFHLKTRSTTSYMIIIIIYTLLLS